MAEIEDDQVERPQSRDPQAFLSRAGFMHMIAFEFQASAQETADLGLVVDNEHHRGVVRVHASDALQAPAV